MEFVKKNWAKVLLAIISFVGFVLILVPLFTAPEFNFIGFSQILGIALFFLGLTAVYVLKTVSKEKGDCIGLAAKYTLLATGVLSLVFMFVGVFGISSKVTTDNEKYAAATTQKEYKAAVTQSAQGVFGGAYFMTLSLAGNGGGFSLSNIPSELIAGAKNAADVQAKLEEISKKYNKEVEEEPKIETVYYSVVVNDMLAQLKEVRKVIAGLEAASTNETAVAQYNKYKESLLDGIDETIVNLKKIVTVKTGLVMSYIAMMLVFGLFPIVKGAKGLVCHYSGCCGSKREEKPAPAPEPAK